MLRIRPRMIFNTLHTQKDVSFEWTKEGQHTFGKLKDRLVATSVLAYPMIYEQFVVETNANIRGAILAKCKKIKGCTHWHTQVVLRPQGNCGITELEILAVVWAGSQFRQYHLM